MQLRAQLYEACSLTTTHLLKAAAIAAAEEGAPSEVRAVQRVVATQCDVV